MPTTRRTRTIAAPPERVWEVVADPYHLPRWWPHVSRVEGVEHDRWTKVLATRRGTALRADEVLEESVAPRLRRWHQDLTGTPFARHFRELGTGVELVAAGQATDVTLELRQRFRGMSRLGGALGRRGAIRLLDEALESLEAACGGV